MNLRFATFRLLSITAAATLMLSPLTSTQADDVLLSVADRFAESSSEETPDFQKHVMPLLGKLGCNGRACHGSFQGRGGFRLSLFGYDFKADHTELTDRVDVEDAAASYLLEKPLMEVPHEGGQRLKPGSWQHNLLVNWIKEEARGVQDAPARLSELKITPSEVVFNSDSDRIELKATAIWSDGSSEDVTALCRFQSNDDQIADITSEGTLTPGASGDTHVVVFYDNAVVPVPVIRPVSDQFGKRYPEIAADTQVDKLIVKKLSKLGIVPSELCTDEEFLRRASLDVTGALPTPEEILAFVKDTRSDKRAKKIDELLERPGYVGWWTTRLCDFTGNSDDQLNNVTPVRTAASQQWYDWIYKRVEQNVPYDDLVEGMVMAKSREPGESYEEYCENMSRLYHKDSDTSFADRSMMPHYWSRANFRSKEDRVIGFAYTFLGVRIQCAQCHKHPFDQWTQDDFNGFQGFFSGVEGRSQNAAPENRKAYQQLLASLDTDKSLKGNQLRNELGKRLRNGAIVPFGEVYASPPARMVTEMRKGKKRKVRKGNSRTSTTGTLLGEEPMDLTPYDDVREPLMAWLRSPENRLFARAFVNRVWANYFHAGIVNPPDDMNLANPPRNSELLDYLSTEFIAHDFDMKWLHREILNSDTYQRSWVPNDTNRLDERNFSRAVPRRIPAEIAWDMVTQAVSNDETYQSFVTSLDDRAISIPGSGARRVSNHPGQYALTIFGRSLRESNCDCDRSEEPSLLQTIFLRNDSQLLNMLSSRNGWLSEVAKENDLEFEASAGSSKADAARQARLKQTQAAYRKQLKQKQEQLRALRKKDGAAAEKAATRLEKQIAGLRQRYQKLTGQGLETKDQSDEPGNQQVETSVVVNMIEDAYLRTLSRHPSESELKTAQEFVASAKTPMEGLESVMWALLNTKEFIVNH